MSIDRRQAPEQEIDELADLVRAMRAGRRPPPGAVERALSSAAALLMQLQAAGRMSAREAGAQDAGVEDAVAAEAALDVTRRLRAAMRELRELTRSTASLAPWAEYGFVLARDQPRQRMSG